MDFACLAACQHNQTYKLATYKLDRNDHSAYVTAAADMQHAMYTWSHGLSAGT